ncbi:MAG: hypothetical protein KDA61_01835, partial [Planctomycetales bacterium]|nr:hypothetical protein [Planctomycetales bacterium]
MPYSTSRRVFQSYVRRCALAIAALGSLALLALASQPASAQVPQFGGLGRGGFGGFGQAGAEVTATGEIVPAADGRPALIFVTADIADGWHLYAIDQGKLPDGGGPVTTTIVLAPNSPVQLAGPFQTLTPPDTHLDTLAWEGLELREHAHQAVWVAPLSVPEGVDAASLAITCTLEGQVCKEACIPIETSFEAKLGDGVELPPNFEIKQFPSGASPAAPNSRSTNPAVEDSWEQASSRSEESVASSPAAYDIAKIRPRTVGESTGVADGPESATGSSSGSLAYYLLTAFVGGIILNVMPCVLPVIGLKVMSFVQQSGESRARALLLNLWYSAGILAVFLALATMAVVFQQGWGEQFASAQFNIVLLGLVFAMALSLLGVWEIPIPGFVGSGAAVEIAEREGPAAAFLKGILTTLLATPCTGPFMATALAWAVRQESATTYSVFAALGLGMASPYLLIGAFPKLIAVLPKPGMWMETFKKAMGLVLLATVVWILSFLDPPLVVPSVALMVAMTGICGWLARTPLYAPLQQRLYAWTIAGLATAIAALLCFGVLYKQVMLPRHEKQIANRIQDQIVADRIAVAEELDKIQGPSQLKRYSETLIANAWDVGDSKWQAFSLERLAKLTLQDRRAVLVDFTADWCLT